MSPESNTPLAAQQKLYQQVWTWTKEHTHPQMCLQGASPKWVPPSPASFLQWNFPSPLRPASSGKPAPTFVWINCSFLSASTYDAWSCILLSAVVINPFISPARSQTWVTYQWLTDGLNQWKTVLWGPTLARPAPHTMLCAQAIPVQSDLHKTLGERQYCQYFQDDKTEAEKGQSQVPTFTAKKWQKQVLKEAMQPWILCCLAAWMKS